jgi:hypothetical protein
MNVGKIMKKIVPLDKPAVLSKRMQPEPKTPAKPVPEPKFPTMELGKPLQKPRVVLSPKEQTTPRITEANSET